MAALPTTLSAVIAVHVVASTIHRCNVAAEKGTCTDA
jgi:hypothetical protein